MKALSVRAPWWWFILHAGKDIENRDWPTKFCGTIYLHSSKWNVWRDIYDDIYFGLECCGKHRDEIVDLFSYEKMEQQRGCLVGTIDIVDCVDHSDSPWFFGKYGFVLTNPVAFPRPIPFKGALGFFEVPDNIETRLMPCFTGQAQ